MLNTDHIIRQVLKNCDISDAKHAGLYSVCGLALRLRDLFKWEKQLEPWIETDSSEILEWIGTKEEYWAGLDKLDYCRLSIDGKSYDPFETESINQLLAPKGMLYGAGYAQSLKPTFFLALIEHKLSIGGIDVFVLGDELARDLLTLPALSQNGQVYFRKSSAKLYFWDQIFYLKKSGKPFLNYALKKCGIDPYDSDALKKSLNDIMELYQYTYIYHEIGEIKDTDFDSEIWREIIGAYPQSIVEYYTRTIKDLLADTNIHGTLHHFIRERKEISLALYAAFFDGLGRNLFPELRLSLKHFIRSGDWDEIKKAVHAGYETAKRGKDMLMDLYQKSLGIKDPQWIEKKIETHINSL